MSFVSRLNISHLKQSKTAKNLSLLPSLGIAMALSWFCIDLAFRLNSLHKTYWIIDLETLAVVALIICSGIIALRHHILSAKQNTATHKQ
jgi:hypothetical protein